MPIYEQDDGSIERIAKQMLVKYHGPLHDAEVKLDYLFARSKRDENGDATGPALKLHGYQCAAVVKVLSAKDRAKGLGDAEIVVDGDRWHEWSMEEKEALLDHELQHLELKTDEHGCVIRDDLDRPTLRCIKHDHQFGWFDAIARRHGAAAFEVQQAQAFLRDVDRVQQYFPGFEIAELDEAAVKSPAKQLDDDRAKAGRLMGNKSGISSITISAGGRSATLKPGDFEKIAENAGKALGRGKGRKRAASTG